jgi:hypothetical protein
MARELEPDLNPHQLLVYLYLEPPAQRYTVRCQVPFFHLSPGPPSLCVILCGEADSLQSPPIHLLSQPLTIHLQSRGHCIVYIKTPSDS